ncbi:MAG TPA: fused MFS/spermidine synthase, partial [Blastocatellia bacterium]|nr:fused MFS/spermidine synthase [Blastocatellia bacterium]
MAFSKVVPTGQHNAPWAVLFCFFASGLSGLVYQVVWVRELILVFGATTFAVSTVLTAFMGGLALGSYYFGKRVVTISRPLRLYGIIEIGIGIYGLAVPFIFALLPNLYQPIWQKLQLSFLAISVVRFAFAALVLILPTALMGATLPVLSTYYARDRLRIGLHVGVLYALNTFGAVIGAAATGFVLISTLGMRATTATAAGLNILLGIVAIWVSSRHELTNESAQAAAPVTESDSPDVVGRESKPKRRRGKPAADIDASAAESPLGRAGLTAILACFGVSGFIALSYEVIWSRVLALIIGSSVYAFSIMLTTFLIGLAVGAWVAARYVDRIRRPVMAFALIEIAIGVASL